MKTGQGFRLLIALAALIMLQFPGTAGAAVDCAFEDVNDDGIFDAGDVIVADSAWIGGVAFVTRNPFVVPVGCDHTLLSVPLPLQGVKVTATKITFLAKIDYLPPGGRGVVFIADPAAVPQPPGLGDGSINIGNGIASNVVINAGGSNNLPINIPAVPQKAVALLATGECKILNASLLGNRPIQNTKVGILCTDDIFFRQATVVGSKVNIQSLTGQIDARSSAPPPSSGTLADLCDDPVANLVNGLNPPGNGNGVVDPGDFPCQLDLSGLGNTPVFPDLAALATFCLPTDAATGINKFHAFNDPLIMIAGAGAGNNLDVSGAPTGRTSLVGRYRVTLSAEDGDVLSQNADVDHGEQLGLLPPGGAKIWVFADPTTIARLPVDHEDFFGPSAGSTDVAGACYQSPSLVQVGRDAGGLINVIGVPLGPPCKANPGGFAPVLNGNF